MRAVKYGLYLLFRENETSSDVFFLGDAIELK